MKCDKKGLPVYYPRGHDYILQLGIDGRYYYPQCSLEKIPARKDP
nr:hypothetical protein [Candidatus Sigynarchaeum springense]